MPTTLQVVDVLTKALGKYPFLTFRSNMRVEAIPHATLSGDDNERNHHQYMQSADMEDSKECKLDKERSQQSMQSIDILKEQSY